MAISTLGKTAIPLTNPLVYPTCHCQPTLLMAHMGLCENGGCPTQSVAISMSDMPFCNQRMDGMRYPMNRHIQAGGIFHPTIMNRSPLLPIGPP